MVEVISSLLLFNLLCAVLYYVVPAVKCRHTSSSSIREFLVLSPLIFYGSIFVMGPIISLVTIAMYVIYWGSHDWSIWFTIGMGIYSLIVLASMDIIFQIHEDDILAAIKPFLPKRYSDDET